jgi:rhodanese-related sulfurtransferase
MSQNREPKTVAELVADARTRISTLTPEQISTEMKRGALLIDIREGDERAEHGSIPGAVHAPRGMLEFWADPTSKFHRAEFDPSRHILIHCAAGGRSSLAADTLGQLGYPRVAHMDGGFERWVEEGRPVEGARAAP